MINFQTIQLRGFHLVLVSVLTLVPVLGSAQVKLNCQFKDARIETDPQTRWLNVKGECTGARRSFLVRFAIPPRQSVSHASLSGDFAIACMADSTTFDRNPRIAPIPGESVRAAFEGRGIGFTPKVNGLSTYTFNLERGSATSICQIYFSDSGPNFSSFFRSTPFVDRVLQIFNNGN